MQDWSLSFYRTYRAPSRDGTALIEPSLADAAATIAQNQAQAARWNVSFGGMPLGELRGAARRELVTAAVHYSRSYRDIRQPAEGQCIVMAGHQPSLFHPGVWFKNFALGQVATGSSPEKLSAAAPVTAINLVIDNDVASSSAIRVPLLDSRSGWIRQQAVAFDEAAGGVPYEQNRIRNREIFDSFDVRVREAIGPLVSKPLVSRLWAFARAAANRCENVSCAVAQARHALEGELGSQTLELPLSVVCRSEPFSAFTLSILSELPRFREIYNDSIRDYRRQHGIRSNAHPVPELGLQDGWVEAPFWIYGDDSPQRRAVWARRSGAALEIADLNGRAVRLSSPLGSANAAEELASHSGPCWKLRPRALMTTMYARMILSDLFIHGIGGAKYDQLGNRIMHRFFGVLPPQMMVVSATILLPIETPWPQGQSVAEVKRELRNLRFSPERFASQVPLPAALLDRKRQLLNEIPADESKMAWHDELMQINQALESHLSEVRADLESRLTIAKRSAASTAILRSRENSFCLFEQHHLVKTFDSLLAT